MVLSGLRVLVAICLGYATPVFAQKDQITFAQERFNQLFASGKFAEALVEAQKLERLAVARFGTQSAVYADALAREGKAFLAEGQYKDAEERYKRALGLIEKADKATEARGTIVNGLGSVYRLQGRYAEAEDLYRTSIGLLERFYKADHPEIAATLNELGSVYWSAGRYADAESLYQRALSIQEDLLGRDHASAGFTLNNLANAYIKLGRYANAESTALRALAIRERALGADHPEVANSLITLAVAYRNLGRAGEGIPLLKRALAIQEKTSRPDHPSVAFTLTALANANVALEHYAEAQPFAERALRIREDAVGPDHPDLASVLKTIAQIDISSGHLEEGLKASNRSAGVVIARLAKATAGSLGIELSSVREFLDQNLAVLSRAVDAGLLRKELSNQAFEVAQWANQSPAGVALNQMAARFGAGKGPLAKLVREQQDASRFYQGLTRTFLLEISKPVGQRSLARETQLRQRLTELDQKLERLNARLATEFPQFADLAAPQPLAVAEAQHFLGRNEALVFFLTGATQSYVFTLTRDAFDWRTIPVSLEDLTAKIGEFRRGLDLEEFSRTIAAGKPELFDLGLAHDLYAMLLKPLEGTIQDKRRLIVVPSGPLTSLPFHLLLTEEPTQRKPELRDMSPYREAQWLLKRHAISVLPAVASLRGLRVFGRKKTDNKPLVGFGDPIFTPSTGAAVRSPSVKNRSRQEPSTRGYADFWRGAGVARDQLAAALPPLPATADELNAVATSVNASKRDVHLREDANETVVKTTALEEFNVVYFATHGLVAGDVSGIGEPSLALTLPTQPNELDDGLLTASEVAELKLSADWVILSACNTASGDRPGAEALSGLARAFFYAGARALLVSHWAVGSEAATRITTATFELLRLEPKLGRSEALRRAMLTYLDESPYPAYWAPFSVIGEGAAQ